MPEEILHGLKADLLKGPIHYFATLPSTNDLAKELGAGGAPEGTLVVAEGQTHGRGRLGRTWDSPPLSGLYVSVVLRPPIPPLEMPQITLTAAVAVVRALSRATGLKAGIKWPNDILLNGKKAGGILTEMETETDRVRYLVVGVGLNVNNPSLPGELAQVSGRTFSRLLILQAWLEELESLYGRFLAGEFPDILAEWRKSTVTLGQMVTVKHSPKEIQGLALEVGPDGALLVQTAGGEIVRVTSGEIAPGPVSGAGDG